MYAELIAQRGEVTLLEYASPRSERYPVPVLIVTPLLVNPSILDLCPGLSFVEHLTQEGLQIFLIDFGRPDRSGHSLRFEDYLQEIGLGLEKVLARTGAPRATLLGYCLGGLFATLYTSLNSEKVANLITLASPFDFSAAGPLYWWIRRVDVDRLVNAVGNIPGEWIRSQLWLFASLTMPERTLRIWLDRFLHVGDRASLQKQRLVARWLDDLRPFPGEAFRQFIKEFIQGNKLVKRELVIGGNVVDPSLIRCPVLVLAHTADLLAPPVSAKALLDLLARGDCEFFVVSGGHVGHVDILVGTEGPAITWPLVSSWLKARSG